MTNLRKTAAFAAANIFTPVSGGVLCPHDLGDPEGPNTVLQMSDEDAPRAARRLRAETAMTLMGFDSYNAESAAEWAAMDGGSARDVFNRALRRLQAEVTA